MSISRRHVMAAISAIPWLAFPATAAALPVVEVWKSPTCGCCGEWMRHLEANGFEVKTRNEGNNDIRARLNMPVRYGSCHTGVVAGYAVEGHVPAREIHRLLKEKPAAVGLAAPGMPLGSPGMDGRAYGGRKTPHDVLLVLKDGTYSVYASYR